MNVRVPPFAVADDGGLKDKPQRRSNLPPSLPPRGLSRLQAAEYVGISPSHFDKHVRLRDLPPPKRLGSRVIWDRKQLDGALDALDAESAWTDDDSTDSNSWDQSLDRASEAEIHKRGR